MKKLTEPYHDERENATSGSQKKVMNGKSSRDTSGEKMTDRMAQQLHKANAENLKVTKESSYGDT